MPKECPLRQPLGSLASAVAVAALPMSAAVMTPAEKLPEASRRTSAPGVLVLVAALVSTVAALMFAAIAPPTVHTLGLGKVPQRSPPAGPLGGAFPAAPVTEIFQAPEAPVPVGVTGVYPSAEITSADCSVSQPGG